MRSVIDFHTHYFSRTFFETLAAGSPLPGSTEERLANFVRRTGLELPGADPEQHLKRWTDEMERYGLRHMLSFASVPPEAPVVADAVRRSQGRLFGLGVIDPTVSGAAENARVLLELHGFRGLLFFPALHDYSIDGSEAAAVLAVLEARSALAVVQCGMLSIPARDHLGYKRTIRPERANPLHVIPAADRHPNTRFVIPHFGAGFFRETLMAGRQCENVLIDTSSSNSWIDTQPAKLRLTDVFERSLEVFGTRRILFGTDSGTFPRGWRNELLTMQREALGALGLEENERQRIFYGNAAELLGLEREQPPTPDARPPAAHGAPSLGGEPGR